MTKAELRKLYRSKRAKLSDDEYREACDSLCSNFFREVDLNDIRVIHTFLPIVKNREPDTMLILGQLLLRYPDIRISVPRVNADDSMTGYYYEGSQQIVNSGLGIPEPAGGIPTEPAEIDLILMPLLAFDQQGHRVGYGKGFYDRFLISCRPDCIRAGLSLFPPEEKIDDVAEFDQPMNLAITPERVYRFEAQSAGG